jgi:hypothetical protein
LKTYGWSIRNDPAVNIVANRIVELAKLAKQAGCDRAMLRAAALKSFRDDPEVSGV